MSIYDAGWPLPDQEPIAGLNNKSGELPSSGFGPGGQVWECGDALLCAGTAQAFDWTTRARRFPDSAYYRAQFHECLVEMRAGPVSDGLGGRSLHKSFRELPQMRVERRLTRISIDGEDASEHPDGIAVENWHGLIEGDAAEGARGVAADARKSHQGVG